MSIEKRVAYWIRFYRIKGNLSQAKLAQLVHVAQNTLSHWEARQTAISIKDLGSIAIALNVDIRKFFDPIPEQKQPRKIKTFEELRAELGNAVQVEVKKR